MCEVKVVLDNISIVLFGTRFSENIGASVRAMRNMGINKLIVVEPNEFDIEKVSKMATHICSGLVEKIVFFDNLKDALAPFNYVVGTTARLGKGRIIPETPEQMSKKIVSISQNNLTAILFGPENKGLTNDDLKYCHSLVNIPTKDFSSINLAQAVMIICYELCKASQDINNDLFNKELFIPRLATRQELDGMYEQLEIVLKLIKFIRPQNPDYWINRFRSLFSRLKLQAKEIQTVRGFLKQVVYHNS